MGPSLPPVSFGDLLIMVKFRGILTFCPGTLAATVIFRRAPHVKYAVFSNDLSALQVYFDSEIKVWTYWCSLIPIHGPLGISPQCFSNGKDSIKISLGVNATVLPGSMIDLPSWSQSGGTDVPIAVFESVLVQLALLPTIPQVIKVLGL